MVALILSIKINKSINHFCFMTIDQIFKPLRGKTFENLKSSMFILHYYFYCHKNTYGNIQPLNKFLSVHCITVTYRHNVVRQISRTDSFCILYPLNSNSSFPPPPSAWHSPFYSLLCSCFHMRQFKARFDDLRFDD